MSFTRLIICDLLYLAGVVASASAFASRFLDVSDSHGKWFSAARLLLATGVFIGMAFGMILVPGFLLAFSVYCVLYVPVVLGLFYDLAVGVLRH